MFNQLKVLDRECSSGRSSSSSIVKCVPPILPQADACHEKTDLKAFVVVIPKEGWARYDTDFSEFDSADNIDYILENSVSYQKKDDRARQHAPILLLV